MEQQEFVVIAQEKLSKIMFTDGSTFQFKYLSKNLTHLRFFKSLVEKKIISLENTILKQKNSLFFPLLFLQLFSIFIFSWHSPWLSNPWKSPDHAGFETRTTAFDRPLKNTYHLKFILKLTVKHSQTLVNKAFGLGILSHRSY
jgi:hypothetical protein